MFKHIQNLINGGPRFVFKEAPAPAAQAPDEEPEAPKVGTREDVTKKAREYFEQAKRDYRAEHGVDMPAEQRDAANRKAIERALKEHKDDVAYAKGMAEFEATMAEAEQAGENEYGDVLTLIDDVMTEQYTESEKKGVEGALNIDEKMKRARQRYDDQGKEKA